MGDIIFLWTGGPFDAHINDMIRKQSSCHEECSLPTRDQHVYIKESVNPRGAWHEECPRMANDTEIQVFLLFASSFNLIIKAGRSQDQWIFWSVHSVLSSPSVMLKFQRSRATMSRISAYASLSCDLGQRYSDTTTADQIRWRRVGIDLCSEQKDGVRILQTYYLAVQLLGPSPKGLKMAFRSSA